MDSVRPVIAGRDFAAENCMYERLPMAVSAAKQSSLLIVARAVTFAVPVHELSWSDAPSAAQNPVVCLL